MRVNTCLGGHTTLRCFERLRTSKAGEPQFFSGTVRMMKQPRYRLTKGFGIMKANEEMGSVMDRPAFTPSGEAVF